MSELYRIDKKKRIKVHKYDRETVVLLYIHKNIEKGRKKRREKIPLTSQRFACSLGKTE